MRIVMGLGGNALLLRNEAPEAETQRRNVERAISVVAPLARRHQLVITHGNGPQIGLLALQSASYRTTRPYPLDLLGAESQGMIGYLLDLALRNALPDREIATLLPEVEVDPKDPAFAAPEKPIGPLYCESDARRIAAETAWRMMRDAAGWRRAVPSPMPLRIRQTHTIALLLEAGVIVVCAGGGGIPVVALRQPPERPVGPAVRGQEGALRAGRLSGIEAVIDKDHTSALLAEALDADLLLLLSDVRAVWSRWPAEEGEPIGRTTPRELASTAFAAGSMRPKVEAACRFVEKTGRIAAIGAIEEAEAILEGSAGTRIEKDGAESARRGGS